MAAALALAAVPGRGQDFKEIAPKPIPPAGNAAPQIVPPPAETAPAANPNQVIIPELKGLVLLGLAQNLQRRPIPSTGITIQDLPLLDQPELRARLAPFMGKSTSFGDLQKIQQVIIAWYRERNRPFIDVAFPEQDVSSGVLQAIVTEFHLGKLRVEGNQWFSSEIDIKSGAPGPRRSHRCVAPSG